MDTEQKKESGKRKVLLNREAFDRVVRWVDQIKEQRKGAKVNPSDMVEFILQSHSEDLSGNEVRDFQDRYVSEIDLARWAVKELMAASARGEKLTLTELLATQRPKGHERKREPNHGAAPTDQLSLMDRMGDGTAKKPPSKVGGDA